jgi:hypothetical protein
MRGYVAIVQVLLDCDAQIPPEAEHLEPSGVADLLEARMA